MIKKSNERCYALITLSHAERRGVSRDEVLKRLCNKLNSKMLVVAKEEHSSEGSHYHVGLLSGGISRSTGTSEIRRIFKEFEGSQCNVSYHKGWSTICRYITKVDKEPLCWGTNVKEVLGYSESSLQKKQGPTLWRLLKSKESWEEVLADDELGARLLTNYWSVRSAFADLRALAEMPHVLQRVYKYLEDKEGRAYVEADLKEKWPVVEWLVYNLCRARHLKQRQLFILGGPSTHKSNLIEALSEFLQIYKMPRRRNDFSGAGDHYDLWVLDEWQGSDLSFDILNMILDGQKVNLDRKYGSIYEKKRNVPVILLGTNWPSRMGEEDYEALSTRLTVIEFSTKLAEPIQGVRLAKTVYGRMRSLTVELHGERFVLELENKAGLIDSSEKGLLLPKSSLAELLYLPKLAKQLYLPKCPELLYLPISPKRRGRPRCWVSPLARVLKAR